MAEHSKVYTDLNRTLGFATALRKHFSGSVLFEDKFVHMEESIQNALKLIESHPDVIRCKNCKKSIEPCNGWGRRCELLGVVTDDFYCGWAERKEQTDG